MFKFFEKQSFPVILLVFGLLLILLSIFDPKDIAKLNVDIRTPYIWPGMIIGFSLSIISFVLYSQERLTLGWFKPASVETLDGMLQAKFKQLKINIHFGQIQELAVNLPDSMVVLPANEYFDDECINDTKSALGAYIQTTFPNLTSDIQALIKTELDSLQPTQMEKEPGITQSSYGIGSGVFINKPLNSDQPVLFLSVTTKRTGEGLRAEMSYIFEAVKRIQQVAADNRIKSVCIPIMGTGHGGLKKEVGLFALTLAICDGVAKPSGHHIKDYNIVVFRSSSKDKPTISIQSSKRILKTAIGFFS